MKTTLLLSTALLCLVGAAGSASATTIVETFTGTIQSGSFDLNGLFGSSTTLDGETAKLIFTIHTDKGTSEFSSAGGQFKSGENYSLPEAMSASVLINGKSQTIDGTWFGTEIRNNNGALSSLDTSLEDTGYGSARAMITVFNTSIPGDLSTPFTFYPGDQTVFTTASASFNIGAHSNEAGGSFTIASASVQVVPLPAALPMFATAVLGIGLVGMARRGRKSKAAIA